MYIFVIGDNVPMWAKFIRICREEIENLEYVKEEWRDFILPKLEVDYRGTLRRYAEDINENGNTVKSYILSGYYIEFEAEEDCVAFKLKFG